MSAREGVTRTGREANMCKVSAADALQASLLQSRPNIKKQTPLVNRVYDIRVKLVHKAMKVACNLLKAYACHQILILGSGQDVDYDAYGSNESKVFLVDFPEVINERKQSIVSSFVKAVGVDMTHTTELISLLVSEGFVFEVPTVIVFECVLCYINVVDSNSLLSYLASTLSKSVVISYDPVLKSLDHHIHGLSRHMREKFTTRGAPLLSCSNSISHRLDHFLQSHWSYVTCINLNHAVKLWLSGEEQCVSLREPFDEFTSLIVIHNHYAMTIASCDRDLYDKLMSSLRNNKPDSDKLLGLSARISCAESQLDSIERSLNMLIASNTVASSSSGSSSSFKIRQATNSDSSSVTAVYSKVFEEIACKYGSVRKFIKSNVKVLRDLERNFSCDNHGVFYVAEVNGLIVGCVGCRPRENGMELSHLSVSEEYQKSGIGRALVNKVISHCKALGAKQLDLSVLNDLTAAIRLYSTLEFSRKRVDDLGNGCILNYMSLNT